MSLTSQLAYQALRNSEAEERLDLWAVAGIPTVAELLSVGMETQSYIVKELKGWSAYVWCYAPARPAEGFRVLVKRHCRTRRIAIITANYFRLHTLINQFRNLNDSLSSNQ